MRAWQEHTREVFSVDWSNLKKDTFASSSWDGTVKIVSLRPLATGIRNTECGLRSGRQTCLVRS
jgi:WD40 repeat protein